MKQRIAYLAKFIGLTYFLFFLLRVVFYIYHFDKYADTSFVTILGVFFAGTLFDTVSVFYLLSPIILYISFPMNHLSRTKTHLYVCIAYVFLTSIAIVFNLMDVIYFDYSQRRTGDEIFFLVKNSGNVFGDYLVDFWWLWVIYLVLIIPSTILLLKLKHQFRSLSQKSIKTYVAFCLILGVTFTGMRGGYFRMPLLTPDVAKFVDARYVALVTNTPHQIISTLQFQVEQKYGFMSDAEAEKIYNPYHHFDSLKFTRKNVVIIILESFDKEYIGYYNNGKGYTPFLDSMLTQGVHFQDSYACGTRSIECPPAVLSSIPSLMHDSYINSRYNTNRITNLGSILQKEGYYTSFYHGGANGTMNFDSFIGNSNFGKYYGKNQYSGTIDFDGKWGIYDEPYLSYYADELNKMPKPFCSAVFTLSSHHPYSVPEKYKGKFSKGTLPIHESIGYTDYSLRKFFEKIRTHDWYDNTLFILTADHTSITENKSYVNLFGDHCVPILFLSKNLKPEYKKELVVQHKDIMPSALHLLGYNKPFFALGTSAFDTTKHHFFVLQTEGSRFWYYEYPYLMRTNPDNTDYVVINNNDGQRVSKEKTNEINTKIKAYLQIYQNRMIDNKLY